MMSEPRRDRRPTEYDGNTMATVLAWVKGEWRTCSYAAVKSGIWWRPIDQTPPPEPEPKRRHMTGGDGTKWISVLPGDPPDLDALLKAIDRQTDYVDFFDRVIAARHGEGGEA